MFAQSVLKLLRSGMAQAGKVKIIARILKKRFKELSAMEAVHIGYQIVEALEKETKVIINGQTNE